MKCACPFADLCPPSRQAVAQVLEVTPETCLVYTNLQSGARNPTSREEIPCAF